MSNKLFNFFPNFEFAHRMLRYHQPRNQREINDLICLYFTTSLGKKDEKERNCETRT